MAVKILIGICAIFVFLYRWKTGAMLLTKLIGKQRSRWIYRILLAIILFYLLFSIINSIRY